MVAFGFGGLLPSTTAFPSAWFEGWVPGVSGGWDGPAVTLLLAGVSLLVDVVISEVFRRFAGLV